MHDARSTEVKEKRMPHSPGLATGQFRSILVPFSSAGAVGPVRAVCLIAVKADLPQFPEAFAAPPNRLGYPVPGVAQA